MTDQFVDANKMVPITPPLVLVEQWRNHAPEGWGSQTRELWIATQAARWGADQELNECCKWLPKLPPWSADDLRRHRRPEPPSLKEQALSALQAITLDVNDTRQFYQDIETIKTALEQLDD